MVEREAKLDLVFSCLSDPTRRDMVKRIAKTSMSIGQIAEHYTISFAAVAKHVNVLVHARHRYQDPPWERAGGFREAGCVGDGEQVSGTVPGALGTAFGFAGSLSEEARERTTECSRLRTVEFDRVYDAPIEQVRAAWTEPEALKQWWGPDNVTIPECEVDLRVGGRFYIVMEAGESDGAVQGNQVADGGDVHGVSIRLRRLPTRRTRGPRESGRRRR